MRRWPSTGQEGSLARNQPCQHLDLDVQSSELWENVFLLFKSPVRAKLLQSCPTLCDPMNCSPPGSSVRGILQARILEKGCHFLLQGIFLTQGSNPHLLHWPLDFLTAEPPGKPDCMVKPVPES